jgi:hypothetical protein
MIDLITVVYVAEPNMLILELGTITNWRYLNKTLLIHVSQKCKLCNRKVALWVLPCSVLLPVVTEARKSKSAEETGRNER